jgi:spermine oxidase
LNSTKWHSNKFIRGSYSFSSIKGDETNFTGKILSQPICAKGAELTMKPILYFAGEACHEKYFSTTHGAFLSGTEQAVKCAKAMANNEECA